MLRLLDDISQKRYDAVLCMDIDRLGRGDMASQGMILDTLRTAECLIVTPRRVYDLNNEMDETYSEFEAFMARQEDDYQANAPGRDGRRQRGLPYL